jgi:hypothetical protein
VVATVVGTLSLQPVTELSGWGLSGRDLSIAVGMMVTSMSVAVMLARCVH